MSAVHKILRNRLYTGEFEWKGKLSRAPTSHSSRLTYGSGCRTFWTVGAGKRRGWKHDFAFSGLIECAHCGCALVGEIKKQRYVYYHCTGYAEKCRGNPASCRRHMSGRRCWSRSSPKCSAG